MKLFNYLWAKISFTIVLLILIIMASVTYMFTVRQIDSKRREVRENMGRLAKQIASIRLAETEGWYVYQDWIDNIINSDFSRDIIYIAIFDEKDSLAAYSLNMSHIDAGEDRPQSRQRQANIIRQLAQGQVAEESHRDFDHQPVDIRWGDEFLGTVDVGFSLIELNDSVRRSFIVNLAFLAVFSIVGVLASVIISRRVTKSLNRLSTAMLDVSRGDFSQIVPIETRDEVGQLAKTYNFMIQGLQQKEVLEKFSRELGFIFELSKVAQRVTEQISQSANCDRSLLLIRKEKSLEPVWDYPAGSPSGLSPFKIRPGLGKQMVNWRGPLDLESMTHLTEFRTELMRFRKQYQFPRLSLIVPIIAKENLVSFLALGPRRDQQKFSDEEKRFLSTLAGQAAFAIENAMLLEELKAQERLKRELEIARNVQMRLLPQQNPVIAGLDVHGLCLPAHEVGGDYYDYFYLDDHRVGLAVADVSGKGTSAAFYMAEIKGMMASLTKLMTSPREVLCHVNARLYHSTDRHVFATMLYAVIDVTKREITFARAGHNALLLKQIRRPSDVEFLIPSGMGLGLTDGEMFDEVLVEERRTFDVGDTFLFFTDGISEAMAIDYEEFGEERLAEILSQYRDDSMQQLCSHILSEVNTFSKGMVQHDDITMIAVHSADGL